MPLSPNMRGATFMVIAMAAFVSGDAISKAVLQSLNIGQLIIVRGLFATTMIAILCWSQDGFADLRHIVHPAVACRAVADVLATLSFLGALLHMPLANATAVLQALPLAVTMGAALFLGETVGWRRWLAISAGFTGILIIVRPGFEGFNVWSLLALGCVLFCAIRDLVTRKIPSEVPTLLVSTVTSTLVTLSGCLIIVPLGGWAPMQTFEISLLAMAAVVLIFGYQFIIMSMRTGDISFVSPFRYTGLLWAILLSFFIFGDLPDAAMIVGSVVVVISGLYTLYRERVTGRSKTVAESTSPGMGPNEL